MSDKKYPPVFARVTLEERAAIDAIAKARGTTRSAIVREAIRVALGIKKATAEAS